MLNSPFVWVGLLAVFLLPFGIYWKGTVDGKAACRAITMEANIAETHKSLKDKDNARKIVNETDDIDRLLSELGILRPDADR